jgi:hypothetical protein
LRTCWLLLLEEYGVTFECLPGKKNVVADDLSRLDIDSLKIQEKKKKHKEFSQDQKTTASVISNEQSQCILP